MANYPFEVPHRVGTEAPNQKPGAAMDQPEWQAFQNKFHTKGTDLVRLLSQLRLDLNESKKLLGIRAEGDQWVGNHEKEIHKLRTTVSQVSQELDKLDPMVRQLSSGGIFQAQRNVTNVSATTTTVTAKDGAQPDPPKSAEEFELNSGTDHPPTDNNSLSLHARRVLHSAPIHPPADLGTLEDVQTQGGVDSLVSSPTQKVERSSIAVSATSVVNLNQLPKKSRSQVEMHIPVYERDIMPGLYQFAVRNTDTRPQFPASFTCTLRSWTGKVLEECVRQTISPGFEYALAFEVSREDAPAFFEFHTTNMAHLAAQLDMRVETQGLLGSQVQDFCVFILAIGEFEEIASGQMYDSIEEDVFYYNLCSNVEEFVAAHRGQTYIRYMRENLTPGTYVHTLRRNTPLEPQYLGPSGQALFYLRHARSSDFLYKEGPATRTFIDTSDFLVVPDKSESRDATDVSGSGQLNDGVQTQTTIGSSDDEDQSRQLIDYLVADDGYTTMSWRRLRPPGQVPTAQDGDDLPADHGLFGTPVPKGARRRQQELDEGYFPEHMPSDVIFEVSVFHDV